MNDNAKIECERHIITLADGVTMAFRRIPACPEGFLMGSRGYAVNEEPIHRVVIPELFWMAETPVTQAQFAVWTQQAGIEHKNYHKGSGDLPAEQISRYQAEDFCNWFTKNYQAALPRDVLFATLPCEAHWEYACRGGTTTDFQLGDGEAALIDVGWCFTKTTYAVSKFNGPNAANRFGLYDKHGLVAEWCLDRWDEFSYRHRWDGITDREILALVKEFCDRNDEEEDLPSYVARGGVYGSDASMCRSAFRFGCWALPFAFYGFEDQRIHGFRVCLVSSPFGQTAVEEPERTASQRRDGAKMAGSDGEAEILNTNFTD